MASATLLHQPPPTTAVTPPADNPQPQQTHSAEPTSHDNSPNAPQSQDLTTQHTTTTHSPSEHEQPSRASSIRDGLGSPSPLSSVEVDAEGSPDVEYPAASSPISVNHQSEASLSSSDQSPRPGKRKLPVDEDDYIRNDPELYGLRRSGRATQAQRMIESSSEDGSDSDLDARPANKRRKAQVSQKQSKNPSPDPPSLDFSDSESDTYGGRRARAFTKKARRLQSRSEGASATPSLLGEVRFSTRRAAKVTTYNEDEDEDEFVEDPDSVTPNYWPTVEDNSPAIDVVLHYRLPADTSHSDKPRKEDYEYQIKWQGKAHYHATWEPHSELAQLRGAKRVKNFFEHYILSDNYYRNDPDVPLEEKEDWIIKQETKATEQSNFTQVERVIDTRQGEEETEYLVKWRGLFYDSCTWESGSLVSEIAQNCIDRYLDRESSFPSSNKVESNPETRSPYKPFREQPSYVKNGQLREFQIRGLNFLAHNWCKNNNVILADEMGLGKTVQTVAFMSWLRNERQQQGPFLVVVPLSTVPAWAETFDYWAPDMNYIVYLGNDTAKSIIHEKEFYVDGNNRKTKFNVLLTTYEAITHYKTLSPHIAQIKWQFLAVDEAHRLKNKTAQLYERLMSLGVPSRLLITGTPVQNNLAELSALMNFLMPGRIDVDEDIDLSSNRASEMLSELTGKISPYIIRRTKQKVENDLPPKTEKIIRVELSDFQLEYYKNILTRNYAALNQGGNGHKQSLLNIMMELKKASNHPFMFPSAEGRLLAGSDRRDEVLKALVTSSGKMMLLDQLLTKMKKDGHRVLIFSQMVKMLDIMSDYLRARGHQFQRLDGTVPSGTRKLCMDHFNAPDSKDFCFLLSTRAGGLGINLMTADTVILFDSDWNPQADLQAMARAHRIGQKHPVTVYRFVSKDTIEEEILERARNKLMLEFITIQRGVTDKDTSDLNKRINEVKNRATGDPKDPDDINRILKRRGQKMFEQSGNQRRLEELDIDAVLENAEEHQTEQPEGLAADGGEDFLKSFEYTDVKVDLEWDQIIPEERLAEIKAEEKRKEEERALAQIIEQNAPRKRKPPPTEEREQRAAKKRARSLAVEDSSDDGDSDSAANLDPKRPMVEKEIRNLIRAYEKFGHIDDRPEDVLKEAKLEGRDMELVRSTLNEVIDMARNLFKAEQDRLEALAQSEGKVSTKKDRKAVVFDYRGVKRLNAETLIERQHEMRLLRDETSAAADFRSFRVPRAMKTTEYTADWGAREDGMLCVGVARHGHGSWAAIRDDPELGLSDKFFLEENQVARKEERNKADNKEQKSARSPGAVHLVRRTAYLLDVIKAMNGSGTDPLAQKAMKAVANHHRNTKKHSSSAASARRVEKSGRPSSSPGPANIYKAQREAGKAKPQKRDSSDRRPSSNLKPPERHGLEIRELDRQKNHRRPSDHYEHGHSKHNRSPSGHNDYDRHRPSSHHTSNGHARKRSSEELDPRRPNQDARDGHAHKRSKSDHHTVNGDRYRPSEDKDQSSSHVNGYKHHDGHHRKENKQEHHTATPMPTKEAKDVSDPPPPKDAKWEDFCKPLAEAIEQLRKSKELTEREEKLTAIRTGVVTVGDYIIEQSRDKEAVFQKECWDYIAAHHWPLKKTNGDGLKSIFDKAKKAQVANAAPKE